MSLGTNPRRRALRNGLRAIGAIGLLLAAANFGWHVWLDLERGRTRLAEATHRLAANASARIGYEVAGAESVLQRFLEALSDPELAEEGCPEIARSVLRETKGYLNLGLVDAEGFLSCDALDTQGRPSVGDRPYIVNAMASKSFAAGAVQISRTTGKLSLNYALPMLDADGNVVAVAGIASDVEFLLREIEGLTLPDGTTGFLVDGTGIILARTPPLPGIEGSQLGSDAAATVDLIARGQGALQLASGDQGAVIAFAAPFTAFADQGISFVLTIPEQRLLGHVRDNMSWPTVLISLLFVSAATAVWILGDRFVVGPVLRLARATERLGRGDYGQRIGPPYDDNEIGTLQRTFDGMSAAIEEREARLAKAQRRARLAYWTWIVDAEDRIEWSTEAPTILGTDTDRLPCSVAAYLALVHPDDRARVAELYDGLEANQDRYEIEYRIMRPGGQVAWLREIGDREAKVAGARFRAVGTIQDVTDQKTTEIRLRESRDMLVQAQRRAKLAYWRNDVDLDSPVEWSDAAAEALGLPAAALPRTRREYRALVHPDDLALQQARHRDRLASGRDTDVEYRLVLPNGDIKWVREIGRIEADPSDGRGHVTGTLQDITDIVRLDAERRTLESQLRSFMDHAPFIMYVKGLDGRYLLTNAEHERVFGIPGQSILGSTTGEICSPEVAAILREHDAAVLSSGQTVIRERSYPGYTQYAHVIAVKFPVRDDEGNVVAIGGFEIDVGDRKRVEQQLFHAQKMEAIGQLTGGLAHDFNNICGVIIGNLDLLQERLKGDADAHELLNEALGATLRGAELNSQLLAFSRRQPLQPKITDVCETVMGMSKMLARTLGEAIEIRTILDPRPWPILVDVAQLESAMLNLAVNARDAMPEGGTLTIEVRNMTLDEHYAESHGEATPGDHVMISVSDTGTGMPQDAIVRAFEPFFTTKGTGKGTGLGLAMVHGFVKQSGGHATIYSELGHGTTVKLYFRRADESQISAREDVSTGDKAGNGETILVVEDNEGLRRIVQRQLRELGYRTIEAANAQAALAILRGDDSVALVLTDVVMPGGMDGRALASEAMKLRPGVKLLFTSGFTEAAATARASEFVDRLLTKPYRKADLARMVRRILDSA